jgi:hypothetical protein
MSTDAAYFGIRTIQRQETRSNDSQNKLAVPAYTLTVKLTMSGTWNEENYPKASF